MGKDGHYSLGISISSYRCESKERRRKSVLQDCGGDCRKAANVMGQVLASYPDNEIERKARVDKRYFNELQKSRNRR